MTEPTDTELDAVLCKHWPAFSMQATLVRMWVRAAMRDAIAKWNTPLADQQAAPKAAPTWPSEALVWEALQAYLKHDTNMEGMRAALIVGAEPRQEAQEPVVAAVFDEQLGRPMLVEGAPMLSHGQPLYTTPQPAPESIRSILIRCREFIDTTKVPAYPAGADLADEIDVLLAAQPAPAPLSDDVVHKTWVLLDELEKLRGARRDEEDWDTLNKRDDELRAALGDSRQ